MMRTNYRALKILYLCQERERWDTARGFTYCAQLGFEEGLQANGIQYVTLTTPCFGRLEDLCRGQRFDQVWTHVYPEPVRTDFWDRIASLAPVRVGFLPESLQYRPEELARIGWLREIEAHFQRVSPYLTHVVTCDETDASSVNHAGSHLKAMWWPQAVPSRFVCSVPSAPRVQAAVFVGSRYPARAALLERDELRGLLVHLGSPETGTVYPKLFGLLQSTVQRLLSRRWLPGANMTVSSYLAGLRRLRRHLFGLWMERLREGAAVVNLPHYVKTYSGRVVEAIACGRPAISWEIPHRPRNRQLFEPGRDIMLFDGNSAADLASTIKHVIADPDFAGSLVRNAQRRLREFHTTEHRVLQIVDWTEQGEEPVFW